MHIEKNKIIAGTKFLYWEASRALRVDQVEKIVSEAVKNRKVVEVDYVREEDGERSNRLMEPVDVSPGTRSRTGEVKFWGWCLHHNRLEQKTIKNIVRMNITEQPFDPSIRRQAMGSLGGLRTSRRNTSNQRSSRGPTATRTRPRRTL